MNTKAKLVCASLFAVPLMLGAACSGNDSRAPLVGAIVNDGCSVHATADACRGDTGNGCQWIALGIACPASGDCPSGVCVTPDPCGKITDRAVCQADDRCAWSAVEAASSAPILCPAGQDCGNDGFCHGRDLSGGGCACVQPIACPPNSECPAVQCDCGGSGSSGGGTCTCACPPCAAGQSCQPCDCACGGGGGSSGGTGCGQSTCTCACPPCAAGQSCQPCDCACGAGTVGVGGIGTGTATGGNTSSGAATSVPACTCPTCPPNTACAPCDCGVPPAPPPNTDPCTAFTDSQSCSADTSDRCTWYALGIPCMEGQPCRSGVCQQAPEPPPAGACGDHTDLASCWADTAHGCSWISLGIGCSTDPCPPSGRCVAMTPVPGSGGGGCGCACPACVSGETCPPCNCTCCPDPAPIPPPQGKPNGG